MVDADASTPSLWAMTASFSRQKSVLSLNLRIQRAASLASASLRRLGAVDRCCTHFHRTYPQGCRPRSTHLFTVLRSMPSSRAVADRFSPCAFHVSMIVRIGILLILHSTQTVPFVVSE